MIFLGNVWNVDPGEFDEVWVICRSVGELRQVFNTYKNVLYVPEFLKDIRNSTNAPPLLLSLVRLSNEKKILLACFCSDELEHMCHRLIVAGIMINMGAKVVCADEYAKYRL